LDILLCLFIELDETGKVEEDEVPDEFFVEFFVTDFLASCFVGCFGIFSVVALSIKIYCLSS